MKFDFKEKWQSLSPGQRQALALTGLFLVLGGAGMALSGSDKPAASGDQGKLRSTNVTLPRRQDTTVDMLAGEVSALTSQLGRQQQDNQSLSKQTDALQKQIQTLIDGQNSNQSQANADVQKEVNALRAELDAVKASPRNGAGPAPGLDDPLNGSSKPATEAPPPKPPARKIAIIGGDAEGGRKAKADKNSQDAKAEKVAYLPAGAMFEGVLLNGMDAPTSQVTIKNPVPAVIRIKSDAILPNAYKYNIRECFMVVAGHGVLATERAQLRLETLSCVKTDGKVIEAKAEGYVVGQDGKVGLRGRLVSKQGAMLAKALMAGFLSGVSSALKPAAVPGLNISPGSSTQLESPSLGDVGRVGAFQGASDSARMISQFYLDMANQMFPVIEIDALRSATIVLVKGIELNENQKDQQ